MARGGREAEKQLLRKIAMLSKYHAKNVEALARLRNDVPIRAWEDRTELPEHIENVDEALQDKECFAKHRSAFEPNTVERMHSRFISSRLLSGTRRVVRFAAAAGSSRRSQPTVVQPFRSMETNTAAWKQKIRHQDELELQDKRDQEEAINRERERFLMAVREGKEFPGVIARSNAMTERRLARIVEAETEEEERRKKLRFTARPVHLTDQDWQTIQERQRIRRKQRAEIRKVQTAAASRLPTRMAMHARQQHESVKLADKMHTKARDGLSTHTLSSIPHDRIRALLARKQRRWDQQLAAMKQVKQKLFPQTLPMEQREEIYRQRTRERVQREHKKAVATRRRAEDEDRRRKEKAFSAPVPAIPRVTHSFLLKAAEVKATMQRERNKADRENARNARRCARLKATGEMLAEVLRKMDHERGMERRPDTQQEADHRARESRKKYRLALAQNKAKLQEATVHRPTLWERHDVDMRKEAAKKRALSTIADKVFNAKTDVERRWCEKAMADKIFDEEERVALGFYQRQ